jgi:Arc/MetJ-type ribon-helix-helix transcriptional regulator
MHMAYSDMFCTDLKEYLENGIDAAKRRRRCCVMLLLRRMLRKEGRRRFHVQYAVMLKKLFPRYIYGRGMYIIPLEDAEKMLADIDQLCKTLKSEKKEEEKQPKEKMVLISFHLPKNMLYELDKYAEINYTTRSDAVRKALEEMLKKYQAVLNRTDAPPYGVDIRPDEKQADICIGGA